MHQISCFLQLHNCTSFLIWDSNQLINIEIISLRKWYYLMHDLFLRIVLTEKSWLKCHHFSVLFYQQFADPFSKRSVQRLWCCQALLSTSYFCTVPGSSHLVGYSFLSAVLTVSCCSAKGPCTCLLHRPFLQSLQYLFQYCFKVCQDFYHPCYKTIYATQSSSCNSLFFLFPQLLEHRFSAKNKQYSAFWEQAVPRVQ